ncbi:Peptidyl-prolyl cis-trans isomerase [Dirofilaria immitis]|nr:Peptidyl-prolyl cis-trans isomerase [Dirofilaria immitis]
MIFIPFPNKKRSLLRLRHRADDGEGRARETPGQPVCKVIIKEIESFNRKRLLTGHVDSLAAYVDLPSADIWRCFNSLMQLHNYVHNYELAASNLKNILSRDSFSDEFITAVINFVNIEQSYKPIIMNAVSKYPSFRSLHCRLQITAKEFATCIEKTKFISCIEPHLVFGSKIRSKLEGVFGYQDSVKIFC